MQKIGKLGLQGGATFSPQASCSMAHTCLVLVDASSKSYHMFAIVIVAACLWRWGAVVVVAVFIIAIVIAAATIV